MSSTSAPFETVIVDDRDPSIHYTGTWMPFGAPEELFGTTSTLQTSDSSAIFSFNGTGIEVFGTIGEVNGTGQLLFKLDGVAQTPFAPSSSIPNLIKRKKQLMFSSGHLDDRLHQLVISTAGGADPNMFLDYLLYNITAGRDWETDSQGDSSSLTYLYDDSSTRIQYDPNWVDTQDLGAWAIDNSELSKPLQNTTKSVGVEGGSFKLNFTGSSVSIYVKVPNSDPNPTTTPSTTSASIQIDGITFPPQGNPPLSVQPNPPDGPFSNTLFFDSGNSYHLEEGKHLLSVNVPTGSIFSLDYILVKSVSTPVVAPAGTSIPNTLSIPTANITIPAANTTNTTTTSTTSLNDPLQSSSGPVSSPSTASSTHSKVGSIAGAAAGGIITFLLVMLLICYLVRRRKQLSSKAHIGIDNIEQNWANGREMVQNVTPSIEPSTDNNSDSAVLSTPLTHFWPIYLGPNMPIVVEEKSPYAASEDRTSQNTMSYLTMDSSVSDPRGDVLPPAYSPH